MGMTKRDYEQIAQSISKLWDNQYTNDYTIELAAEALADSMAKINPRFDAPRFLKACGVAK